MGGEMSAHKDMRGYRTKRALAEAMFDLLGREDFQNITVNDICAAASVSRNTFYVYFEDKYRLALHCMEEFKAGIAASANRGDLRDVLDKTLTAIDGNRRVFRNLLFGEGNKELERILHLMFVEDFTALLTKRQEEGKAFDVPPRMIAVFLAAGISYLIIWWISGAFAQTKEEMVENLMKMSDTKLE